MPTTPRAQLLVLQTALQPNRSLAKNASVWAPYFKVAQAVP